MLSCILSYVILEALDWIILLLRGHLIMSGDIFGFTTGI